MPQDDATCQRPLGIKDSAELRPRCSRDGVDACCDSGSGMLLELETVDSNMQMKCF